FSCELPKRVKRFVCQTRTTDHGYRVSSVIARDFIQPFSCETNRVVPRRRYQPATFLVSDQWRSQTIFMIDERVSESTFHTKELTVQSVYVTIARNYSHYFAATRAERH